MPPSLHQRLKDTLVERFQDLTLGSRLPSTRDLAAEFGVAYLTINRVLRDLEHDGYIVRKAKQGTFLANRERPVGRDYDHAPGASGTVVFIHPDYYSFHYWSHLQRAEAAAVKGGLRLAEFKIPSGKVYDRAVAFCRSLSDLAGVIMLPVPGSLTTKTLGQLNDLGVPVVFVSDVLPTQAHANLYSVDGDHHAIGALAVDTLVGLGHRHLAHLHNEPISPQPLRSGFAEALGRHGLPDSALRKLQGGVKAWDDSRDAAYELIHRILDDHRTTAVILDSINGVYGVQRALWEKGLQAPKDLSLLAIGNSNRMEEYFSPPVTTIDWDRNEETRLAFAAIAGSWPSRQRHIGLEPKLYRRSSTAIPGQGD